MVTIEGPREYVEEPEETTVNQAVARARALVEVEKWERALTELRQALALDPNGIEAHYLSGLCYLKLGQHEKARAAARQTVGLYPAFAPGFALLAQIDFDQDRYRNGLKQIDKALEIDPDDADYLALKAALLLNSHKTEKALQHAVEALCLDPENTFANHVRALALTNLGRHAEAEMITRTALSRDPDSAVAWYQRGVQLLGQGRVDEAKAAYLEALRIDPELTEAQDGLMKIVALRHPFFALFWRWTIYMHRFPQGMRWLIIGGMWLLMQLLKIIARGMPQFAPIILPFMVLYVLFCIYTWVAGPLFLLAVRKGWIR
ncbi:MAG: tetratricopeptide repeat protein [Armatimonadota bacterium]